MEALSEEEIKKVELDALRELDRVCAEHGLTYFLVYGTKNARGAMSRSNPWTTQNHSA